jgi:hypothetical protein
MKFGGDPLGDFFGFVFWIVGSFLNGGVGAISYLGSGFIEQIRNFVSLLSFLRSSLPSAPSGVGMGIGASAAYINMKSAKSWFGSPFNRNGIYRQGANTENDGTPVGGKRRSKRNKRKSVKRSRTHKK